MKQRIEQIRQLGRFMGFFDFLYKYLFVVLMLVIAESIIPNFKSSFFFAYLLIGFALFTSQQMKERYNALEMTPYKLSYINKDRTLLVEFGLFVIYAVLLVYSLIIRNRSLSVSLLASIPYALFSNYLMLLVAPLCKSYDKKKHNLFVRILGYTGMVLLVIALIASGTAVFVYPDEEKGNCVKLFLIIFAVVYLIAAAVCRNIFIKKCDKYIFNTIE